MKKALLLGAALAVATGAMAQLAPGEYYIKSVNTGMYLNEGFSWGTLAVTKAYPCAFEVTADGDGYLFKSRSRATVISSPTTVNTTWTEVLR